MMVTRVGRLVARTGLMTLSNHTLMDSGRVLDSPNPAMLDVQMFKTTILGHRLMRTRVVNPASSNL
jgi:hypothetical protein